MTYLETERLILRDWNIDDLPAFAEMNMDAEVMRYFPSTLDVQESKAFYNRIQDEFSRNGWGLYAVELKSTGRFIGYTGLHEIGFDAEFTPGIEIGWRLASEYHNNGYATEAAMGVLSLAGSLGLKRIYSFTARINKPSERVMQKIGMSRIGDFVHPSVAVESPLSIHVLYRIDL